MSGLKLVVPGTFTDTSMQILRDDPILTPGSLLLLDPAHAARSLAAGVPASGGLIPNLAYVEAAATIGGSPSQASMDSPLLYGAGLTGTKGKLERSTKGGIHGIVSQAVALASGDGAHVTLPAPILAYLVANKAHRYYVSAWDRVTRIIGGTVSTTGPAEFGVVRASNSDILAMMYPAGSPEVRQHASTPIPSTNYRISPSANAAGNRFVSLATTVDNGLVNTSPALGGHVWGAPTGSLNAAILATRNLYWPSMIFYRFYIEDLTISGRTYAAVDALDYAEYTKQVLTAGGRYFADSFTAPSTIA